MRRGQVSVEYLAIFGLVLLAIVGAVSFISGTGFLNPCQATTPSFTGQPFTLEEVRFTGTNEITASVSATTQDLNNVGIRVDTDGDGASEHDSTNVVSSLSAGASGDTITLSTGDAFASGECASVTFGVNYSTEDITQESVAWGSTSLTRTAP
ncbi:MAG: hypothetical protein MUP63_00130 [Candidatus Nanohaloarchaeota archaeon QJJ-7]|nr:hypothetical protein [Candidatus Nanohaloarchaeota archaeon QJJ-7]